MVDTFSVVVITLILSYFTLIFGELVPKRIAMQKSLEMARLSCRVVSTLAFIARPVVALLSLSTNGVLRLLRMKTEDEEEQVTEDEIRMMIDLGNENGAIDAEEKELLQNVFEFGDLSVSDAMTRVGDVTAIQVDTPPGEVLDVIRATGLSRFPVYGSDLNDILGILNARDLLLDMASSRHRTVRELMRPAYLVPETLSADDLFRDMQHKKVHLAVVIDEYGELAGVVTRRSPRSWSIWRTVSGGAAAASALTLWRKSWDSIPRRTRTTTPWAGWCSAASAPFRKMGAVPT